MSDPALPLPPDPQPTGPAETPHAGLRYALLRLLMLLAVAGLLFLIGMRGWPWLFASVLLSAAASWFVLFRQREAAARSLEATVQARKRHSHDDLPHDEAPDSANPAQGPAAGAASDAPTG